MHQDKNSRKIDQPGGAIQSRVSGHIQNTPYSYLINLTERKLDLEIVPIKRKGYLVMFFESIK